MPKFDITAPNGKTYEIEGDNAEGALAALQQHLGPQPSTAEDIGNSAIGGLGKGTVGLAGTLGDTSNLLAKGSQYATDYIAGKLGIDPGPRASRPVLPTSEDVNQLVGGKEAERNAVGQALDYKPQTTYGKYTGKVAEFLPGAMAGPGGTGFKLASGAASGLGSEALGQYTEGGPLEPYARVAGAVAGSLAPMAAGRAITPLAASPQKQRLVDILRGEGVTSLTAGQRTGNKALQYAEDALGNAPGAGGAATNIKQRGQEQFTEASMRRAGAGPDASPEVLANNQDRLGQQFRDLSARNTMTPDNQFITDVTDAVRQYRNVPNSQQAQIVQGYIDDIVPHVNAGGMSGVEYQAMRSRLSRQANNNRQSDPDLSEALRGVRNALDSAMGRSISPADREAWQTARQQYGAQKTLEKTASKSGDAITEGQIPPSALRNTVSAENRGAYSRGEGQFSELARAGAGVMAPLPNSGTAQRSQLSNLLMLPVTATAGRALMSRPVQAYLGNQVMTETLRNLPSARRQALIRVLIDGSTRDALAGPSN